MKITMQKIADDLNISKMTVSRYFNGGVIAPKTKERIEAYVETHNYTPNYFASYLKKESDIIGFVTPRIDSVTSNELIHGVLTEAKNNGLRVIIHSTQFEDEIEIRAINEFMSLGAKGLIVVATENTVKNLSKTNYKNPLLVGISEDAYPTISYPEREAIAQLLKNATQQKIQNIYYFHTTKMLSHRRDHLAELLRTDEYCNLTYSEHLIDTKFPPFKENSLIICATDNIAYKIYEQVDVKNLLEKDIFIAGFGGYKTNKLICPSLTSVCFPYEETGKLAVKKIIANDYSSQDTDYKIDVHQSFKLLPS